MFFWGGFDSSSARLAAAKEAMDHALALDSSLPESHLAVGYYRYYGERDFQGALDEFRLAEQGLPNSSDILKAIALIQRRMGHWEDSIASARRAESLNPRDVGISLLVANTLSAVRRYAEEGATADRVLALEPDNPRALFHKAESLWSTGDLTGMEPFLKDANKRPWMAGMQAYLQRRFPEAIDHFTFFLTKTPDDQTTLLFLGISQQRAGNVDGARATFEQLVQVAQKNLANAEDAPYHGSEAHAALGLAYATVGDSAAVAESQKAVTLQPSSEDPMEGPTQEQNLAMTYALLGDADHAVPIIKRLLQTSYPDPLTPALLRFDSIWDKIRDDPRFRELAEEKKP
jgi:tetratricopeptide (TPR) repeat protein